MINRLLNSSLWMLGNCSSERESRRWKGSTLGMLEDLGAVPHCPLLARVIPRNMTLSSPGEPGADSPLENELERALTFDFQSLLPPIKPSQDFPALWPLVSNPSRKLVLQRVLSEDL